jgi:hypothetical protein
MPDPGPNTPLHEGTPTTSRPVYGNSAKAPSNRFEVTVIGSPTPDRSTRHLWQPDSGVVALPAPPPGPGELPNAGKLPLYALATEHISRLITKDSITAVLRSPFTLFEEAAGEGEVNEEVVGEGWPHAVGEPSRALVETGGRRCSQFVAFRVPEGVAHDVPAGGCSRLACER